MISKYLATALVGTALMGGAAFAQSTIPASPAPGAAPSTSASSTTNNPSNLKGSWRASKLVGLAVYNDSNEKLGDISEVLLDTSGKVNAVIIGVGGFLGVGQHDIAVNYDQLKWVNEPVRSASSTPAAPGAPSTTTTTPPSTTTGAAGGGMSGASATKDSWYPDHAQMSGTKDQLKAMPEFKYSSN